MNSAATQIKSKTLSLLCTKQVRARTCESRAEIYFAIEQERFPQPIHLDARPFAFLESEINTWIEQLAAKRNETD